MKTMTCKQLGGPESCNEEFHAETFEEMGEKSKNHAMEMAQKNDEAHIKVMEKMKEGMNDPEAVKKWMEKMQQKFDAQPEDN